QPQSTTPSARKTLSRIMTRSSGVSGQSSRSQNAQFQHIIQQAQQVSQPVIQQVSQPVPVSQPSSPQPQPIQKEVVILSNKAKVMLYEEALATPVDNETAYARSIRLCAAARN